MNGKEGCGLCLMLKNQPQRVHHTNRIELSHRKIFDRFFLFVDSFRIDCWIIIDWIVRLHPPKNQHERPNTQITSNSHIATFSTEIFFFESTAGQIWNGPFLPLKKNLRSKSHPPAPPPVPPPWTCFSWYLANVKWLNTHRRFGLVVDASALWPCGFKFESYNGRILRTGHP